MHGSHETRGMKTVPGTVFVFVEMRREDSHPRKGPFVDITELAVISPSTCLPPAVQTTIVTAPTWRRVVRLRRSWVQVC